MLERQGLSAAEAGNFFEGRAEYPKFHKKQGTQSASYMASAFKWDGKQLTLAKMDDPLDIHWSRPLPKGVKPTSCTVSDVGWSEFIRQLEYKAQWYGRTLVKIDKFYPSSKRCFDCGHVLSSLTLDVRSWTCPECGVVHDRDINAARNILAAGLAVTACGERVRPGRVKARSGNSRRSRKPK